MIVLSERRSEEIQTLARKLLMDIWARTTINYVCQANIDSLDDQCEGRWGNSEWLLEVRTSEARGLRARWRR